MACWQDGYEVVEERVRGGNGAPGSVSPPALSGVQPGRSIDPDQPAA